MIKKIAEVSGAPGEAAAGAVRKTASAAGQILRGKALLPLSMALFLMVFVFVPLSAVPGAAVPVLAAETGPGSTADAAEDTAVPLWNEQYYRASDTTKGLSDAEVKSLDETCLEFMQTYNADLSLLAVTSADCEGSTLQELAEGYYLDCGFGYGDGSDGFQMVWNTETGEVVIEAFGAAKTLIPESYLEFVEGSLPQYEEKYGHFGPMYAATRFLSNYLRGGGDTEAAGTGEESAEGSESGAIAGGSGAAQRALAAEQKEEEDASGTLPADVPATADSAPAADTAASDSPPSVSSRMLPEGEVPDEDLRVGEGSFMPAWYPKDPASFPFYHDEKAPRVVDVADIFTAEEEAQMETRLGEIRSLAGKDIVVFTDVSTYGLSRAVYAADFYDFNGYGIGDDREGACLMICMDPDNRGWWCCCTGPVTMGLYTETIANQIDDLLFEYMRAGNYGAGVLDWIENFRRLYVTGSPYNEEWALVSKDSFERFHDADAPRVVDDAGLLTADQITQLREQAAAISEKYGVDMVIHTALNQGILDRDDYAELFYITHGYGFGDNYDGLQLTVFKRPNYSGIERVTASGSASGKLTEVNQDRLESRCDGLVSDGEYYEAASQWLSQAEHMLRTGRAPRSSASWGFSTIVELLAGILFGGFSLGKAKAGMATPGIRENADAYLVPGSVRIRKTENQFLHSTIDKRYSPPPKEHSSSGGSSGGHSSYSGSYSGSSGSTHSGSGRNF